MPDTTPDPTSVRAEVPEEISDRWIEAMQIVTGNDDNPDADGRAQLAEVRGRMLAARDAAVRAAAIREAADAIVAQLRGCCDECDACIEITQDITDALAAAPTTTTTPEEH